MWSWEIEHLEFLVFNNKSKLRKEREEGVVAIKKKSICSKKWLFLQNEKTIIYKIKKWDGNIKIFALFSKI